MRWVEVAVVVDDVAAPGVVLPSERVAEVLARFVPATSIVQEKPGDPDDWRLDALLAETWVKAVAPDEVDSAEWRASITAALSEAQLPAPSFALLADQDWQHGWRAHYRPIRVGERFWIRPSWHGEAAEQKADDLVITLDPGMAFGTGTHPTTQLCLMALERLIRPNDSVLDLGCGSGILAIGASLLGARSVLAVDTDADAIVVAQANAADNGVAFGTQHSGLEGVRGQWRIVVANILASALRDMIANGGLLDRVAPGGHLVLSGILAEQAEGVAATLHAQGVRRVLVEQRGEWVALVADTPP